MARTIGIGIQSFDKIICMVIQKLYSRFDFLLTSQTLKEGEEIFFRRIFSEMTDSMSACALRELSCYISRYYGKKVILLLDEYDTPLQEAWEALKEYRLYDKRQKVKDWYDGFTFGRRQDIYNPWSILNFLDKKRLSMYWANTSSNGLVNKLIQRGSRDIKMEMENLLKGGVLQTRIDEQILFSQLDGRSDAVWRHKGYECLHEQNGTGYHQLF